MSWWFGTRFANDINNSEVITDDIILFDFVTLLETLNNVDSRWMKGIFNEDIIRTYLDFVTNGGVWYNREVILVSIDVKSVIHTPDEGEVVRTIDIHQ